MFLAAMSSSRSDVVTQFLRPFLRPFLCPFLCPFVRSSVRSFVRSFIRPLFLGAKAPLGLTRVIY